MDTISSCEGRQRKASAISKKAKANGSPPPEFESDEYRAAFLVRLPVHPQTVQGPITPRAGSTGEVTGEVTPSRRRIDLLGIDDQANLVVIELKRTEDGGAMDLQAIRYAAMVSAMTFAKAVETYDKYLIGRAPMKGTSRARSGSFWRRPSSQRN